MNGLGQTHDYKLRRWCLLTCFGVAAALIASRAFYLQILNKNFLIDQGNNRSVRTVPIFAHRGIITDRKGEPLAVSAPVASVWARPGEVLAAGADLTELARLLEMPPQNLARRLTNKQSKQFVYLKRQVRPDTARQIRALKAPGIEIRKEYKRYYPAGEAASHLIGFTDVDDRGQEGLELAYDSRLRGNPGKKRVLKDQHGHVVQDIENIKQPVPGQSLALSIDNRLQFMAYKELKSAVAAHEARGGTLVMLDVRTGEALALAAQPAFNPNNRADLQSDRYRNRAVTDVFEPGSTIKPFTIAAALMSGLYAPDSLVETQPGYLKIGRYTIRDLKNYGQLSVRDVIRKSSNIGSTRIAMALGAQRLWELHDAVGFGRRTDSGLPGESAGQLKDYWDWTQLELATVSYGYGLSVTALQLTQAYAALATGGVLRPVSFLKTSGAAPGRRVLPAPTARLVSKMMRAVVGPGGSGKAAAVAGYHVAGKTGTVHKAAGSGYAEDRHLSLFAGFAPATAPRLALAVVIDEPQAGQYFGGQVAAPVFARVMGNALRVLNVPPDDLGGVRQRTMLVKNTVPGAGI